MARYLPDNFYPLYVIVTSYLVVHLMTMPCEEVKEGFSRLPSNATMDDIHRVYRDAIDNGSQYDKNCVTIWWKAFWFFIVTGCIVRRYTRD